MNLLKNILHNLEVVIREKNYPIIDKLNEGIKDFQTFDKPLSQAPNSLKTLYEWRNGTTISTPALIGSFWLFEMGIFMSLDRAIQIQYHHVDNNDIGWNCSRFPIFESGGGEFFLLDCDKNSPTYEMIFRHSVGAIEFDLMITQYDSLETLFKTVLDCFIEDVYTYDKDGSLQIKWDAAFSIGKRNNLKSGYWNLFN